MSIIAKSNGEGIERLEDGVYTAQCVGLVDLGEQFSEMYQKAVHKVRIIWNIVGETFKNAEGDEVNRTMGREYSLSLSEKSNLRKDLQAWRGRPFTEDELKGFDLQNILGKACQLQLITVNKNDKTFSDIAAIMSLPKGTQIEPLKSTYIFDMTDEATFCNWFALPEFVQKRIKAASNFAGSAVEKWINENDLNLDAEAKPAVKNDEENLPF